MVWVPVAWVDAVWEAAARVDGCFRAACSLRLLHAVAAWVEVAEAVEWVLVAVTKAAVAWVVEVEVVIWVVVVAAKEAVAWVVPRRAPPRPRLWTQRRQAKRKRTNTGGGYRPARL